MNFWQSLIYGIVQGLTEFLPVSSSGHLVLLEKIFGYEGNFLFFAVILHVATLLAVIVALRKEVWFLIKHPFSKEMQKLVLSTLPTIFIVFMFKSFFESSFEGGFLSLAFVVTGVLLIVTNMISKTNSENEIKFSSAFAMGVAQGFAVIPGISRSGSTLCTGLLAGENKEKTARFSFLMSVPIVFASLIYEIIFSNQSFSLSQSQLLSSLVAFASALIVGILAIKFMLRVVSKGKLWWFSIYLFVLATATLIWL
ncbi:MAG: undecaprenyl-diphosphate phosphatase [Clostridia bacterium]